MYLVLVFICRLLFAVFYTDYLIIFLYDSSLNVYFLFFIIFWELCFLPPPCERMYMRCLNIWLHLTSCSFSLSCRTVVTGSSTVLWGDGWLPESPFSQTWLCSNFCCGWCCSVSLLNWSSVCRSLSSLCSTGFTKGFAARLPGSLESWARTRSSIRTVSLCWALWLQNSWKERWVTGLWPTDEDFVKSFLIT